MSEAIVICIYIACGISAAFGLIKEFKKEQKKYSLILFEFLILIAATFILADIFI